MTETAQVKIACSRCGSVNLYASLEAADACGGCGARVAVSRCPGCGKKHAAFFSADGGAVSGSCRQCGSVVRIVAAAQERVPQAFIREVSSVPAMTVSSKSRKGAVASVFRWPYLIPVPGVLMLLSWFSLAAKRYYGEASVLPSILDGLAIGGAVCVVIAAGGLATGIRRAGWYGAAMATVLFLLGLIRLLLFLFYLVPNREPILQIGLSLPVYLLLLCVSFFLAGFVSFSWTGALSGAACIRFMVDRPIQSMLRTGASIVIGVALVGLAHAGFSIASWFVAGVAGLTVQASVASGFISPLTPARIAAGILDGRIDALLLVPLWYLAALLVLALWGKCAQIVFAFRRSMES